MEAKKTYYPDPYWEKTAIQLQRHEEGFWKKKKNREREKKKRFHQPRIEPSSVMT